jgi:multicomponent Na+:H+ antiporter subunit G
MTEWIVSALLVVGASFALLAAVGVVRMPDLYTRMQAAAKCGTLGVGCTVLAVAVHFAEVGMVTQAFLVLLFLFLTAPVAAHMIGRAGYSAGVPLWKGSRVDELEGRYDPETRALRSEPADPERR